MATPRNDTMPLAVMKSRLAQHQAAAEPKEERIAIGRVGGLTLKLANGKGTIVIRARVAGKVAASLVKVGDFTKATTAADLERMASKASEIKGRASTGDDVTLDRVKAKVNAKALGGAPTVLEVAEAFVNRHRAVWSVGYERTAETALRKIARHLIAKIKAKDLKPAHVATFVTESAPGGVGMSTSKRAREILSRALAEAMDLEVIPMLARDPAGIKPVGLHLPAGTLTREVEEHRKPWGPDLPAMLDQLVAKSRSRGKWAVVLAAHSAMRISVCINARVSEFDLTATVWNIPEGRVGLKRYTRPGDHVERQGIAMRVPLTPEVIEFMRPLLAGRPSGSLVWPGRSISEPMVIRNLWYLVRRIVGPEPDIHGLRTDFRGFRPFPNTEKDLMRMSMGHKVGTAVSRAYDRTDRLDERRAYMIEWSRFLVGKRGAVLPVRADEAAPG